MWHLSLCARQCGRIFQVGYRHRANFSQRSASHMAWRSQPLKLIWAGWGPHVRHSLLGLMSCQSQSLGIPISSELLLECASQQDTVEKYIASLQCGRPSTLASLVPLRIVYLSEKEVADIAQRGQLTESVEAILDEVLCLHPLERFRLVDSVDPSARLAYLDWAIERGVYTLTDKPLCLPTKKNMHHLKVIAQRTAQSRVFPLLQRRAHPGYVWMEEQVRQVYKRYGVPVTFLQAYHGDGRPLLWRERDVYNHPVHHGFGTWIHTGYHFLDLSYRLLLQDRSSTRSLSVCADVCMGIAESELSMGSAAPLVSNMLTTQTRPDGALAESDGIISVRVHDWDHGGAVVGLACVQSIHGSFSRRCWYNRSFDGYKHNGGVDQESIIINCHHLRTIHATALRAYQDSETATLKPDAVGSRNHFDVHMFSSPYLCTGEPLCSRSFASELAELSPKARIIRSFLAEPEELHHLVGALPSHLPVMQLLAATYESLRLSQASGKRCWIHPTSPSK